MEWLSNLIKGVFFSFQFSLNYKIWPGKGKANDNNDIWPATAIMVFDHVKIILIN